MVTQEELKRVMEYKQNLLWWIKHVGQRGGINTVVKGSSCSGVVRVYLYGRAYPLHRLVFLYHYGYIPDCIEHIDGNKLNNAIENLRAGTKEGKLHHKPVWVNEESVLQ